MNQRKASQLNGHTAIEILGVTGSFCLRERFSWVTTSSIILKKNYCSLHLTAGRPYDC